MSNSGGPYLTPSHDGWDISGHIREHTDRALGTCTIIGLIGPYVLTLASCAPTAFSCAR